jgi:2'-5' RNA ligase
MPTRLRAFLAIELSPEVLDAARRVIDRLRSCPAGIKWVAPDHMHLTLQFLGEIAQTDLPEICLAVNRACQEIAPFDVRLRGAGAFPNPHRARTIWLGVGDGADKLTALYAAIQKPLSALGFREEQRRYVPHLTLGRVRDQVGSSELASRLAALGDFEGGATDVSEVVLFSSDLRPDGPVYEALNRSELCG